MNFKLFTILLLTAVFCNESYAQRLVRELETNSDPTMQQRGDTIGRGSDGKFIPTEVRAWTVDDTYGNITPIHVDTLHHAYQNNASSEGMIGEFNTLSNLGSPRINRIYMRRADENEFIFISPYDQFFVPTEKFRHYNTKSPFVNIAYNFCGSKQTGYDHAKVLYTQNIGKRANMGGLFNYMYGQGYYDSQSTSNINGSGWASYLGDRYDFHFYYQHNYMKSAENGGITGEEYLTNPESLSSKYASNDIPTNLSSTWNRQQHNIVYFNHHYNIGFTRVEGDSANMKETFVPVMRIFHTFKMNSMWRKQLAYKETENYHSYSYLYADNDSTKDHTNYLSIKNTAGLSMCEGFNKWAAFGLDVYAAFDYRKYELQDSLLNGFGNNINGRVGLKNYTETDFSVGGQIIRTQGKSVHYNVQAEFVLIGEKMGAFDVHGHGELNFPFLKDTTQLSVNAFIKNQAPSFYHRHYHSKHAWWDQDLDKMFRTRIEGTLNNPSTKTRLTVGLENIKNYIYYYNNGYVNEKAKAVTNNVQVGQYEKNIQIFSATLEQNFKLGPLRLDNAITYQTSSNSDILPLPTLSSYHNLYLDFNIAKVLHTEFGIDCKYFTEYDAPDYSPVINQFTLQNPERKVKIGNHPLLSVYANFNLKRLRFYVQYYHFNMGNSRAFWAPYYPMNPTGIHFGLSWNFYD